MSADPPLSPSGILVVDLGSRNGVRVAGKRVERAVLTDGLEVMLGEVPLRFRIEQIEADEPPQDDLGADLGEEIELEDEILLEEADPTPHAPAASPASGCATSIAAPATAPR